MNQYSSYGQRRAEIRKKKRKDLWLNGTIGVVIIAIVFLSATLIFGGNSDEPSLANDDEQEDLQEEHEEREQEQEETVEEGVDENTSEDTEFNNTPDTDAEESDLNEEGNEENDTDRELVTPENGDWEPIGTVQEEPFVAVYDSGHINREEMDRAFSYATGIELDAMTTWRVGNGGDHVSAVGYVSTWENRNTPYKVRLEWVTNEGWMPVSVEVVDENPYYSN
ncbi:YrrS family protein [Evansella cellulosilytica]|uniref:DUF1510 domain-containing protein n=1 Tax=Evansella cellulosilytica (strain ATCC 21833 / DSM 2522 / FERM P-1141 / JCM 9156 / N-4) TaxID=649639 RepID=E6TVC1_EVAC2|nr:YrrS family protein [Evansella cellulosilytica]ADU29805.1 protein of unknown function DUF1510 [Evansella cellulosilytica DSM 2522]